VTAIKYPEYARVKRSVIPLFKDKFENEQHAYAKARLKDLLERLGYDHVEVEKKVPCAYFLAPNYRFDYSIDVYAEMRDPPNGININNINIIDHVAFEIGGLNTYHSRGGRKTNSGRTFGQVKEKLKKELVCEQYPYIKPERYFTGMEVDKDAIFSREYMRTDEQLIADYKLKDRKNYGY